MWTPQRIYSSALLTHRKSVFQAHASKFSLPSKTSDNVSAAAKDQCQLQGKVTTGHDGGGVEGCLELLFAHLRALHPRTKRATHRMWAYRCLPPQLPLSSSTTPTPSESDSRRTRIQHAHTTASFSDVEHASGPILERLLALNNRHSDVIVVVYRWYGGVKLGSERWRCISGVASEALRLLEAGEVDASEQKASGSKDTKRRPRERDVMKPRSFEARRTSTNTPHKTTSNKRYP